MDSTFRLTAAVLLCTLGALLLAACDSSSNAPPTLVPPTDVSATALPSGGIEVRWDYSGTEPAEEFKLYRSATSDTNDFEEVATLTGTTFSYTLAAHNLTPGATYYVAVTAIDAGGDESDFSELASATAAAPDAAPLACAEVDRGVPGQMLFNVRADTTLSGTYRAPAAQTVVLRGNVTIRPGTVFLMERDAALVFQSETESVGSVLAEGEESRPVLFCGAEDDAGYWNQLFFQMGTLTDSRLTHVRIEDGGGRDLPMVEAPFGPVTFESVGVHNSSDVGLSVLRIGEGSSDLVVTGSARHPVELWGPEAINNLPDGTYTGNAEDVIHVRGFSNSDVTFRDVGVPYLQAENRVVIGASLDPVHTVTFEAGVEYRLPEDGTMQVGWRGDPGEIQVRGTDVNPFVFTSYRAGGEPQPGDWGGLWILAGTDPSSSIEHATFRYGGETGFGNLVIGPQSTINVHNSTFTDSGGAGISVDDLRGVTINGVQCGDPTPPRSDLIAAAANTNTFMSNAEGAVKLRFPPPGHQPCPN